MSVRLIYKLIFFFSIVGLFISSYLFYVYVFEAPLPCGNSGCDIVRYSPYSKIFSIPVPFFGILFYFSLITITTLVIFNFDKRINSLLTLFAVTGVVFSAYFTYLELFIIKAICNWCVASAIICVIIAGLVTTRNIVQYQKLKNI